jgi:hypothetical protein
MEKFLEAYTNDDPTAAELAALLSHRGIMQILQSHVPRGLQIPDVVEIDEEGIGDRYELDGGANPEDDDNENHAALLLALREIVDHSGSLRVGQNSQVDREGLAMGGHWRRATFLVKVGPVAVCRRCYRGFRR